MHVQYTYINFIAFYDIYIEINIINPVAFNTLLDR